MLQFVVLKGMFTQKRFDKIAEVIHTLENNKLTPIIQLDKSQELNFVTIDNNKIEIQRL